MDMMNFATVASLVCRKWKKYIFPTGYYRNFLQLKSQAKKDSLSKIKKTVTAEQINRTNKVKKRPTAK